MVASDPYLIFIEDMKGKFLEERKTHLDLESTQYLITKPTNSRLYLTYNSIKFYNFNNDLNIIKHKELTELFKILSEKNVLELNEFYNEVITEYIDEVDVNSYTFHPTKHLLNFTKEFTPNLANDLPPQMNQNSLTLFSKYKDDTFESNDLTQILKIIRYFGSFEVPFEAYVSEYNFQVNNVYLINGVAFHVPYQLLKENKKTNLNHPEFSMNDFLEFTSHNERKLFKSDVYNLITPELEKLYTPIIATAILSDITTEKGRSFLHYVTTIKDSTILENLLEIPNISDFLEKTDIEGKNVVLYAAAHGSYKNMQVLLQNNISAKGQDNNGNNVLHLAIKNKDFRVILAILQNTPEDVLKELLTQKNNNGYVPINSFLEMVHKSQLPHQHKSEFDIDGTRRQTIIPNSISRAQHILYYVPLLAKELELGLENYPVLFYDLDSP